MEAKDALINGIGKAVLNIVQGDRKKIEKEASRNPIKRKKSTEAFMRAMREQAAKENLSGNAEAQSIKQS
jgi:hypothetical protein